MSKIEIKRKYSNYVQQFIPTSWKILDDPLPGHIFPCLQGKGDQERIGRHLTIVKIEIRYVLKLDGDANQTIYTNGESARVVLLLDKQTRGSQFYTQDMEPENYIEAILRNKNQNERFVILDDKQFNLHVPSTATLEVEGAPTSWKNGMMKYHTIVLNNIRIPVRYKTSSALIGGILDNSLHLVGISERGLARIRWRAEISYIDY